MNTEQIDSELNQVVNAVKSSPDPVTIRFIKSKTGLCEKRISYLLYQLQIKKKILFHSPGNWMINTMR